ncbi:MAG: PAS domain S-box protein [Anaerolineales bacterium]|nr:PAS domain S-box protein [Anaerolineales bacterium]
MVMDRDFYIRAFNNAPALICCIALDGTTKTINPAGERITGYKADELVGQNFWHTLFPGNAYRQVEGLLQTFEQVDLLDYELEIETKDGGRRMLAWSMTNRYEGTHRVEIIGFGLDVSGKRETEREREILLLNLGRRNMQLQLAADVSRSVSTILDTEKLIARTVERIKEAFDYYYVGLFLLDGEAKGQPEGQYAILRAGTGHAGKEMLRAGHKLLVGDGSMIGWSIAHRQARVALDVGKDAVHFNNPLLPETRSEVALPLISRGNCIGALTFQSTLEADFSEEDVAILGVMAEQLAVAIENARLYEQTQYHAAELEKRVEERTAELVAVNQELEAFSYSVSHDLRAPLRAIDGFSQALLEDYMACLDDVGQDYLRRVQGASRKMGQLISDLLKLSRLTRGEMRHEQVDLSAIATEIVAELRSTQPERQVSFIIAPHLVTNGDPHLLRVALENLLGNAWKFTSKQEIAQIEFGSKPVGHEMVYLVRDNGAGFDMTYASKLFGAFQRLHSLAEFEGTGIGLATVQRVIHRHGGRIWAEGQVGVGAVFYFTL